jgi:uncharacterized damage-inducible protein DinB
MYDEYAFGPGRLRWGDPELQPWPESEARIEEVIDWLQEVHTRFVDHVRALSDSELATPRRANWGEARETRWLISMILGHDTYHAGEINHIRSLLVSNDRWKWG